MTIQKTIAFWGVSTLSISALLSIPAIAHQVQIAGDVGGTMHIEPNDNPRAGEPSLAWFALTRQGGELIPLEACNCQLTIYTQPGAIVESPLLEAVSAEGYTGIPGAEVTFPQVGAYELVLQGEPVTADDFQPFELRFPVTVAAGQTVPSPPAEPDVESNVEDEQVPSESDSVSEAPQPSAADNQVFWRAGIVLALVGGTIAFLLGKSKTKK
ncbi:hypothetical protein [Egbenema bharatensis]|uniref:hypothetical protein n=1 Tax=Egbenema bharatensis TaxID=3463334 RepID=UPI003A849F3C